MNYVIGHIESKYGEQLDHHKFSFPRTRGFYKGEAVPTYEVSTADAEAMAAFVRKNNTLAAARSNHLADISSADDEAYSTDTSSRRRRYGRRHTTGNSGVSGSDSEYTGARPAAAPQSNRWDIFLLPGERVVISELVGKKNPVGILKSRQLILTDTPRLFYVDPKRMVIKGQIAWTRDTPPFVCPVCVLESSDHDDDTMMSMPNDDCDVEHDNH